MEKTEPTLVPQWYRAGGVSGNNNNSNHRHTSSSNSDDHGNGLYARNRLTPSTSNRDFVQSSISTCRTSGPYNGSSGFNGSLGHDSSIRSRPYTNFNRSYRDKGRGKNFDSREKKKSNGFSNGYNSNILRDDRIDDRIDDFLPWAHSKVGGRCLESRAKKIGTDLNNGKLSPRTGVFNKSSFDQDFPSLSAEEKLRRFEPRRIIPTSPTTASQRLSLGTSVTIGGKGWTSALAEVPSLNGDDKPMISSTQPSTLSSSATTTTVRPYTGMNMAETVAKALSSTNVTPQMSGDAEKLAELTKKQLKHLIPMTPTTTKSLTPNSSERLKTKGTRNVNTSITTKIISHTSQAANTPNTGAARSDNSKAHQSGNFQVLNRGRNISTSIANKVSGHTVTNSTISTNPAMPTYPKPKSNGIQGFGTDKRLSAQDRISFFNTIRNRSSTNNNHRHYSGVHSPTRETADDSNIVSSDSVCHEKDLSAVDSHVVSSLINGNGISTKDGDLIDSQKLLSIDEGSESSSYADIPDEEEMEFLRSLGWEEGFAEEALTPEEIEDFVRESGHLLNSVKMSYCHHN